MTSRRTRPATIALRGQSPRPFPVQPLARWWRALRALRISPELDARGTTLYLWLPAPRQALLVARALTPAVMAEADHLHRALGVPGQPDAPWGDPRVVIGLPGGVFAVYRGGETGVDVGVSAVMACARCGAWYFASLTDTWECRCCGHADGNTTFTRIHENRLPCFALGGRCA